VKVIPSTGQYFKFLGNLFTLRDKPDVHTLNSKLTYLLSSLLDVVLTGDRLCDGGELLDVVGEVIGELGVDDLSDAN
jgi:hypothetical protein